MGYGSITSRGEGASTHISDAHVRWRSLEMNLQSTTTTTDICKQSGDRSRMRYMLHNLRGLSLFLVQPHDQHVTPVFNVAPGNEVWQHCGSFFFGAETSQKQNQAIPCPESAACRRRAGSAPCKAVEGHSSAQLSPSQAVCKPLFRAFEALDWYRLESA